jgi:hypothetical protein
MLVTACGRVDFAARDGGTTDVALTDVAAVQPVSWAKTFVGTIASPGGGTLTASFMASAANAGQVVVIHLFCQNAVAPNSVTLTAPGWAFLQIAPITGMAATQFWATSVFAIAPDTTSATFAVTWTAAQNCSFVGELGDAFTGADPLSPIDAHFELAGTGNGCPGSVTTQHAGDAIWSACTANKVMATGVGFTKSADDQDGDWSEYKLTSDPANTIESATFGITAGAPFVVTSVAIRPP